MHGVAQSGGHAEEGMSWASPRQGVTKQKQSGKSDDQYRKLMKWPQEGIMKIVLQ